MIQEFLDVYKRQRQRGYFTDYDVRVRIYRGIFAGQAGVTYGHHQVWQFLNPSLYPPVNIGDTLIPWKKAILSKAATQMIHLKNLMLSRPYFERMADNTIITSDQGSTYIDKIEACRAADGSYAMIYCPTTSAIKINLDKITGTKKNAWYFNVTTGKALKVKNSTHAGVVTFNPPPGVKDWVLVIDDASKSFSSPGKLMY